MQDLGNMLSKLRSQHIQKGHFWRKNHNMFEERQHVLANLESLMISDYLDGLVDMDNPIQTVRLFNHLKSSVILSFCQRSWIHSMLLSLLCLPLALGSLPDSCHARAFHSTYLLKKKISCKFIMGFCSK